MDRPRDINIVIGIGIFAVVAFTTYWLLWFAVPGVVQSRMPGDPGFAIYEGFELGFLLADAFVAVSALVGVIGLWSMRDWGFLSMLLAAGGAIFLGLEDLLFDLENQMFVPFTSAAMVELAIVLVLLSLGSVMTVLLWRHRKELIR